MDTRRKRTKAEIVETMDMSQVNMRRGNTRIVLMDRFKGPMSDTIGYDSLS